MSTVIQPTRSAVSAHRARIVGDAVISAYIHEIAPPRTEVRPAGPTGSVGRGAAETAAVRDVLSPRPRDRRPASLRRLAEQVGSEIRRRPPRQRRRAVGEPPLTGRPCLLGGTE